MKGLARRFGWLSRSVISLLSLVLLVQPVGAQTKTAALESRSKGSAKAPITVYEMSDFQCPYCRRFAQETFPTIERSYIATGKVRWIFINYPLSDIHNHAAAAA
jgi:protein-disulfide isomerase